MNVAVIVDMHGCPNRCRHCWLGHATGTSMTAADLRWIVAQFKGCQKDGKPLVDKLVVDTWFREPDYSDDYRDLWKLRGELSNAPDPVRRELASIWRLARDSGYAPWLQSVGVEVVQITLFGMAENTDYFTGRKGAFRDCMTAIDVLLENGIAPRIQIFPFTTTIGDLEPLVGLFSELRLEKRVKDLGKEFDCFINTPTPMGSGFDLEDIVLGAEHLPALPHYFMEKTLGHWKVESMAQLWRTEADLLPSLLGDENPLRDEPNVLAFMVTPDFSVYPNVGEIAEWWRLGNLKTDGAAVVIDTFLRRANPGLRMNYEIPVNYFAREYGDHQNQRLYGRTDLVQRWFRMEGMTLTVPSSPMPG